MWSRAEGGSRVLSASEVAQARRRRRPPPSLERQYQEYVLQRIEAYKNSIDRDELLRLGDEAVSELQTTAEGQFVLTEVLMLESVDRLIMKRLAIRSYRRWRQQFLKLRAAQRQPTRWGIEAHCPLTPLLPRLEPEDRALVCGAGAEAAAYLLAAHDAAVTFVAPDLGAVERVESRMGSEALGTLFDAFMVQIGGWLPPGVPEDVELVVIDAGTLAEATPLEQAEFLAELQARTVPGGVHVLLAGPTAGVSGSPALAPEALRVHYGEWVVESAAPARRRADRSRGLILARPHPLTDADADGDGDTTS